VNKGTGAPNLGRAPERVPTRQPPPSSSRGQHHRHGKIVPTMSKSEDGPDGASNDFAEQRGSRGEPPWVPSGAGVALDPPLRGWRQLVLTALVILAISAVGGLRGLELAQHNSAAAFLLPFLIAIAALVAIWSVALGLRKLRLRRLVRRFPGALVFSFRRSDDVAVALRKLRLIDENFSFNEFGIQVVADLHGLTFWQDTPPRMYAALPWTLVRGTSVERDIYPYSGGERATVLRVDCGTTERGVQLSLFGVDASLLPFPSRSNVEWVERQLRRLAEEAS
jgi:hypothetical protein